MESDTPFETLVTKAFRGDPVAFKELHRRIYMLQLYMGNHRHAEDATQDILLTVWRQRPSDVRDLEAWVLRTAHNQAIDYFRRERSILSLNGVSDPDESPLEQFLAVTRTGDIPEEALERQEFNDLVWKALDELPIKCRSCLVLRLALGVKTAQVAQLHNLCEEQVRRLVRSGKERFKIAYTRLISEQQIPERRHDS